MEFCLKSWISDCWSEDGVVKTTVWDDCGVPGYCDRNPFEEVLRSTCDSQIGCKAESPVRDAKPAMSRPYVETAAGSSGGHNFQLHLVSLRTDKRPFHSLMMQVLLSSFLD